MTPPFVQPATCRQFMSRHRRAGAAPYSIVLKVIVLDPVGPPPEDAGPPHPAAQLERRFRVALVHRLQQGACRAHPYNINKRSRLELALEQASGYPRERLERRARVGLDLVVSLEGEGPLLAHDPGQREEQLHLVFGDRYKRWKNCCEERELRALAPEVVHVVAPEAVPREVVRGERRGGGFDERLAPHEPGGHSLARERLVHARRVPCHHEAVVNERPGWATVRDAAAGAADNLAFEGNVLEHLAVRSPRGFGRAARPDSDDRRVAGSGRRPADVIREAVDTSRELSLEVSPGLHVDEDRVPRGNGVVFEPDAARHPGAHNSVAARGVDDEPGAPLGFLAADLRPYSAEHAAVHQQLDHFRILDQLGAGLTRVAVQALMEEGLVHAEGRQAERERTGEAGRPGGHVGYLVQELGLCRAGNPEAVESGFLHVERADGGAQVRELVLLEDGATEPALGELPCYVSPRGAGAHYEDVGLDSSHSPSL